MLLTNFADRHTQWCEVARNAFLRGIDVLLKHENCSSALRQAIVADASRFLGRSPSVDTTITRCKWLCTWPMAKLNREQHAGIDSPLRFTGSARSWFRARMRSCARNQRFWFSWLQLKRCCPAVPDSFVRTAALKHRATVSGAAKVPDALVLLELERLPHQSPKLDQMPRPSVSAAIESNRSAGGAFSYLRLVSRSWPQPDPRSSTWTLLGHGFPHQGRWVDEPFYRVEHVTEDLESCRREALADWGGNPLEARVEFVLEPLKVRTITKGPSSVYTFARAWQQSVHPQLKKVPGFELIGRPVESSDVRGLLAPTGGKLNPDWEFVSIDYSNATDGMDHRLTLAALRSCSVGADFRDFELWRAAVGLHDLSYPPKLGVPPVRQTNGQLMGSPVSFPLLCKINAATIRAADSRMGLGYLPFLVNGDDALVYRPKGWRAIHEPIADSVGLAYSVGKAYSSPRYANINSVGFWVDPTGRVERLDYLPVGLILGQSKLSSRDHDLHPVTSLDRGSQGVVGCLRRVLASTPNPTLSLKLFLSCNARRLRKELEGRNLFISEPQGGFGLEPPLNWRFRTSRYQERLAGALELELHRVPDPTLPDVLPVWDNRRTAWIVDEDVWRQVVPPSRRSRFGGPSDRIRFGRWYAWRPGSRPSPPPRPPRWDLGEG